MMMVKKYIHIFVEKVKKDEVSEEQMIKIYETFKRHKLTDDEIRHAKNIASRIKSGELTEEMLIEKANKWLSERSK